MNDYIDRMNWAADPRNCSGQTKPITLHVYPSIDCGGLSREDFDEDPEFEEGYFSGQYDVACNACGGRTTVREVDESRLSPELLKAWRRHLRDEAEFRAIQRSVRRRGGVRHDQLHRPIPSPFMVRG